MDAGEEETSHLATEYKEKEQAGRKAILGNGNFFNGARD